MTEVPLHRARASLTWLIERCAETPVTITRNGRAVAVVVHPSLYRDGDPITSSVSAAIRAELAHALALLSDGNRASPMADDYRDEQR